MPLQRQYASRREPAFETATGWEIVERVGCTEAPAFPPLGASSLRNDTVTPPPGGVPMVSVSETTADTDEPSTTSLLGGLTPVGGTVASPFDSTTADAMAAPASGYFSVSGAGGFGCAPVSAEHVSAVFCATNGYQSARSVAEYGTLDVLGLNHTIAGAVVRKPVKYPYSAKGLPPATDAGVPLCRSSISLDFDGTRVANDAGGEYVRHQQLDMQTGVVTCVERRVVGYGDMLVIKTERFTSAADRRIAATRLSLALGASVIGSHTIQGTFEVEYDPKRWAASAGEREEESATLAFTLDNSRFVGATAAATSPVSGALLPPKASVAHFSTTLEARLTTPDTPAEGVPVNVVDPDGLLGSDGLGLDGGSPQQMAGNHSLLSDAGASSCARGLGGLAPAEQATAGRRQFSVTLVPGAVATVDIILDLDVTTRTSSRVPSSIGADAADASSSAPLASTSTAVMPDVAEDGGACFNRLKASHIEAMREALGAMSLPTAAPTIETQHTKRHGDYRLTSALRYNLYTLLTTTRFLGPAAPLSNCALTADGPSAACELINVATIGKTLMLNNPTAAAGLLRSLAAMLPGARRNAANQCVRGSLFPAATVDGTDIAPYFINSAPRVYISCDVANLAIDFIRGTCGGLAALCKSDSALASGLLGLIFETAIAVLDFGSWDSLSSSFTIDGVTGPDEYNPLADGNVYTLAAARAHLTRAMTLLEEEPLFRPYVSLRRNLSQKPARPAAGSTIGTPPSGPMGAVGLGGGNAGGGGGGRASKSMSRNESRDSMGDFSDTATQSFEGVSSGPDDALVSALETTMRISVSELLQLLRRAAPSIVIPRDDATNVYMTHSCFDRLPTMSPDDIPGHPLSLHVHPLVIYRHRVVQVPDVLLAMLRYPSSFYGGELARALEYYKPLCTHDVPASLGVVAAAEFRVSRDTAPSAAELQSQLLCLTLDRAAMDHAEGLTAGPLASGWFSLVSGLLGFDGSGEPIFDPVLPIGWLSVTIPLVWRGSTFAVEVTAHEVIYRHVKGEPIRLRHAREALIVCLAQSLPPVHFRRPAALPVTPLFDGVVVLLDAVVQQFHELNFEAWRRILDEFFEVVRNAAERARNHRRSMSPSASPRGSFEDLSNLDVDNIEPLSIAEYTRTFLSPEFGQKNYAGLEQVLKVRGLDLPLGAAGDAVVSHTRFGLANAKLGELQSLIAGQTLQFVSGFTDLLRSLANSRVRVALVTFSRSALDMLRQLPDVKPWVSTVIDGNEARSLGVSGRPGSDLFQAASERMHLDRSRCVLLGSQLDCGFARNAFEGFARTINVRWVHDTHDAESPNGIVHVDAADLPRSVGALEALAAPRSN